MIEMPHYFSNFNRAFKFSKDVFVARTNMCCHYIK